MNKKIVVPCILLFLFLLPTLSLGAVPQKDKIRDFNVFVCNVLKWVWPAFIGLAIIIFMAAGLLFLTAHGDPSQVKTARTFVIWGIIGVIVAIIGFSAVDIINRVLTGTDSGTYQSCTIVGR